MVDTKILPVVGVEESVRRSERKRFFTYRGPVVIGIARPYVQTSCRCQGEPQALYRSWVEGVSTCLQPHCQHSDQTVDPFARQQDPDSLMRLNKTSKVQRTFRIRREEGNTAVADL